MRVHLLVAVLFTSSACAVLSPTRPSDGPYRFGGSISEFRDGITGAPIRNAELVVVSGVNTHAHATTDASGHFAFHNLERGRFVLSIAAPGYVGVSPVVDLYRDTDADFGLAPR